MAETYKTLYGFDWPKELTDDNIRLLIGKKWREFRDEYGFEFKDPWVPLIDAAKHLFGDEYLKVSEWTEQHFHDWTMEQMLLTWGCASSSKALLPDEPVYYPDHIGKVGEVKIGDRIIDAVGGATEVVGIREQVDAPLYRVVFMDGAEVVCSEDHLWTVSGLYVKKAAGRRTLATVQKTLSAKHLASLSKNVFRNRMYRTPLPQPVAFSGRCVPLDPYVVGCLLGDGCVSGTHVSLASSGGDWEVRDAFARGLPEGYALRKSSRSPRHVEYVVVAKRRRRVNAVMQAVKDLGLCGRKSYDKFIPEVYKVNSVDVRLELLSGLLDTDGWVGKDGRIGFKTTSRRLADDVRFVAGSLGAYTTVCTCRPHHTTVKGRECLARESYSILIHGLPYATRQRLFKLTRKRSRLRSRSSCDELGRRIRSVEPVLDRRAYPRVTRCLTLADASSSGCRSGGLFPVGDFAVTHNSNDTGALIVLDFITDPYDTISLVGSTTRDALRIRTWESIERYFSVLKKNADFTVPGRIMPSMYAILNDRDDGGNQLAQGAKAGIHGVALNDGGKRQGAHLPYVRLVVDELATIANHGDILTTIENLQIAKDFRFVGLANPETWSNPSCQYAIPEKGIGSVTVDTGSWRSTFGCFVRHHDGMKSPCVLHPELVGRFPFLTQKRHIDAALRRAGGNADAPHFWKMVRGFPLAAGNEGNVVLDEAVLTRSQACDPGEPFDPATLVATVAGADPAWTEGGDGACYVRCFVRYDRFGRPYLDFTNGMRRMTLNATEFKAHPAVEQLRNQVLGFMREMYAAPFRNLAVDASGNQGLADDLVIYAGARDVIPVNFAVRASETPLRAHDGRPAKETVHDRGTEAWCLLAEFIRAGQVRGLPREAADALVTRRFAANMVKDATGLKRPAGTKYPLRLEDKAEFKKRFSGKSPDECDACALAALVARDRLGFVPFGYVKPPAAPQDAPGPVVRQRVTVAAQRPVADGEARSDDFPLELSGEYM